MSEEKRPLADEIEGEKLPYPAKQSEMEQQPDSDLSNYKSAGKLKDKVAIITGADSGIGRAVAIAFAMEGAKVAIVCNLQLALEINPSFDILQADIARQILLSIVA